MVENNSSFSNCVTPVVPSKNGTNVEQKQTFGLCQHCLKNSIQTIHILCGHLDCCMDCSKKCRSCQYIGCNQEQEPVTHVKIYPGHLDEGLSNQPELIDDPAIEQSNVNDQVSNDGSVAMDAQDSERLIKHDGSEIDINSSIDVNSMVCQKEQLTDGTYDPKAIRTVGKCIICWDNLIEFFLIKLDKDNILHKCGHGVCKTCCNQLKKPIECPVCCQIDVVPIEIQMECES